MESKTIYECSPLAKDPGRRLSPLAPNMKFIFRDGPHKYRTVQKNFWKSTKDTFKNFLDKLVTGKRSFARLCETSHKLSALFMLKQCEVPVSAQAFATILRNLHYAEQRFDSRSLPLFRLFSLLPVVISVLEELAASGTLEERKWAVKLLKEFGGPEGFEKACHVIKDLKPSRFK